MSISPDGKLAYVFHEASGRSANFYKIDLFDRKILSDTTIDDGAYQLQTSKDGKTIYAAADDYISSIDSETLTGATKKIDKMVVATFTLSPDGTTIYAAGGLSKSGIVSVLSTNPIALLTTIPVGGLPFGIVITADGRKVYVADHADNMISVLDTAANKVSGTIPVDNGPVGLALTPDGKKLYVTCFEHRSANPPANDDVAVIDLATGVVTKTIDFEKRAPGGIAVTPDGREVYVVNTEGNSVSVLDTSTDAVIITIPVGKHPTSFGNFIAPAPHR